MLGRPGADFSFSGLKTALRHLIAREASPLSPSRIADIAASFQAAVADVLVDRTRNALSRFEAEHGAKGGLVVAGGVAANTLIRARLSELAKDSGVPFVAPPVGLCTDNAVMIAWAGLERLRLGLTDGLDVAPRPRWPLDPDAPPAIGAGVKA